MVAADLVLTATRSVSAIVCVCGRSYRMFDGTGLRRGDQLGAAAVVVGYECDG